MNIEFTERDDKIILARMQEYLDIYENNTIKYLKHCKICYVFSRIKRKSNSSIVSPCQLCPLNNCRISSISTRRNICTDVWRLINTSERSPVGKARERMLEKRRVAARAQFEWMEKRFETVGFYVEIV